MKQHLQSLLDLFTPFFDIKYILLTQPFSAFVDCFLGLSLRVVEFFFGNNQVFLLIPLGFPKLHCQIIPLTLDSRMIYCQGAVIVIIFLTMASGFLFIMMLPKFVNRTLSAIAP